MDLVNRAIQYDRRRTKKAFLLKVPAPIWSGPQSLMQPDSCAVQHIHHTKFKSITQSVDALI
jgi:hypothetical protein